VECEVAARVFSSNNKKDVLKHIQRFIHKKTIGTNQFSKPIHANALKMYTMNVQVIERLVRVRPAPVDRILH
jgi:hypothetical protein